MPGVDGVAVDGGGPADRLEPGAVEDGRCQRVGGEGLVEPGHGGGGAGQRGGGRITARRRRGAEQGVEHGSPASGRRRRCRLKEIKRVHVLLL